MRLAEVKKHAAETGVLDDPLFAARLAEAENELLALELTQARVVSDSSDGKPNPASSVLKLRGSQLQQIATELFVEVAGPDALPADGEDISLSELGADQCPALPELAQGVDLRRQQRSAAQHHRVHHSGIVRQPWTFS